jgi:RimJ/RimL family protein N-acetyltransferase
MKLVSIVRAARRFVALRPVRQEDYGLLFSWYTQPEFAVLLQMPLAPVMHFEQFVSLFDHRLKDAMNPFFIVEKRGSGTAIGVVGTDDLNLVHGHAFSWVFLAPEYRRSYFGAAALVRLLDFLFARYNLRKVYTMTGETNPYSLAALKKSMRLEGCLRQHYGYGGRYWDMYCFALYRDDWERAQTQRSWLAGGSRPG